MNSEITKDKIPNRAPNLIWRVVEDNLVIVSPTHGKVRVLNPVGALIWDTIDGEMSVGDIATKLQGQFTECSTTQLDEDLTHFLADLAGKELISWEAS